MSEIASDDAPQWPRSAVAIEAGTMDLAEYLAAGVQVRISEAPELARQAVERLGQRVRGHVEAGLLCCFGRSSIRVSVRAPPIWQ